MRATIHALTTAAGISALLLAGAASADYELPRTLTMTAFGTGSGGYTMMAGVGTVLQERGTSVRILPADTDVERMTPLRTGRVDYCSCAVATYFASEGVLMFAGSDWGPQPVRVVTTAVGAFGVGLGVAGDIGVETPADLRGKRIAYIRGAGPMNHNAEAYLAFGGLTWDDVEKVTFPGYGRAWDGIIDNQADAAITVTNAPPPQRLAASPRGIAWPRLDPDDTEGWERMQAVGPHFQPQTFTSGAGISEDNPWQGATFPYPIMTVKADLEDAKVAPLIRFFTEEYDSYKGTAPGNEGFALERQNMKWVVPFHDAVLEYYKEIGVWTDDMQEHQDMLVQRQEVLQNAWAEYTDSNAPSDEEQFIAGWMEARAAALESAGMDPVFR
ncbi:MAG: TAXI family TRAP transporter solute-binding subunit [Ectothiorhodospiraceae bacterium]|nr:TAXI family TRAP transporter solute-binding subunit [Ectothiorhodospiraceae bacterium]